MTDNLDAIHKAVCQRFMQRAEIEGREVDSFLAEWLRHCEAMKEDPMRNATLLLEIADIDRYCGNRHGPKELEIERRAYIIHRNQSEGLKVLIKGDGRRG